jgi:GMP synthase (glutamine-hydrolysing)
VQAARLAAMVWGVQFHPEVDEEVVAAWAREESAMLADAGLTSAEIVRRTRDARDELIASWRPLAQSFARLARGRAAAVHGDMA